MGTEHGKIWFVQKDKKFITKYLTQVIRGCNQITFKLILISTKLYATSWLLEYISPSASKQYLVPFGQFLFSGDREVPFVEEFPCE